MRLMTYLFFHTAAAFCVAAPLLTTNPWLLALGGFWAIVWSVNMLISGLAIFNKEARARYIKKLDGEVWMYKAPMHQIAGLVDLAILSLSAMAGGGIWTFILAVGTFATFAGQAELRKEIGVI